ncbi:hypothetical protein HGB13_04695 [bacterium]|nr:hypothetical protein [bacterium]
MSSVLVNGLTEAQCHLCKETLPVDKDGCGKKFKKLATVHHLFFPAKLFQLPLANITPEERRFLRRYYRDSVDQHAILCMHKNGDGIKGCHDLLNAQLINGCLGIGSLNGNGPAPLTGGNVSVGKCPLIFNTKPKDRSLQLPNELCEFCFFFQFLCDPMKFAQAIEIVSKIENFDGEISVQSLFEAQKRLRNEGYEVKKTAYPIGLVKGTYIVRYKPVLSEPIILLP